MSRGSWAGEAAHHRRRTRRPSAATASNGVSFETAVRSSNSDCAISMRSKGSRCSISRRPARSAFDGFAQLGFDAAPTVARGTALPPAVRCPRMAQWRSRRLIPAPRPLRHNAPASPFAGCVRDVRRMRGSRCRRGGPGTGPASPGGPAFGCMSGASQPAPGDGGRAPRRAEPRPSTGDGRSPGGGSRAARSPSRRSQGQAGPGRGEVLRGDGTVGAPSTRAARAVAFVWTFDGGRGNPPARDVAGRRASGTF